MRATYRCSRSAGSAKHNDRTFDLTAARHIKKELTELNWNWHRFMRSKPDATFEEVEKRFYEKRYSASLKAINERYLAQYHPERCKTIDDLLAGSKTRPEEVILQIGNKDEFPDHKVLEKSLRELMNFTASWSHEHGNCLHLLNFSVHLDESTPHVHIRRCWDYIDKEGNPRLGQEQALKNAGVEPPKPNEPIGRYNNRKITFDTMIREKWQDILKSNGIELETTPLPRRKHKIKEIFIDSQIAKKQERVEQLEKCVENLERKSEQLEKQVKWTKSLRDKQQAFERE